MPKTEFRRERRIWLPTVSKAAERSNKRRTEMLSLSRAERISFTAEPGRRLPCTDCAMAERGVLVKDRTEMVIVVTDRTDL